MSHCNIDDDAQRRTVVTSNAHALTGYWIDWAVDKKAGNRELPRDYHYWFSDYVVAYPRRVCRRRCQPSPAIPISMPNSISMRSLSVGVGATAAAAACTAKLILTGVAAA